MSSAQKKAPQSAAKPVAAAASAAKVAAPSFDKTTSAAKSAVESARSSVESFVKTGADTVKELFANGAGEASKAQDKVFAIGREGAENLSRAVDAYSRTLNDAVSLFRENADAAIEVCHIMADVSKTIGSEAVTFVNDNFIENIELCKDAVACRNAHDLLDIQSKWFTANVESCFAQSARLTEISLQLLTEAAEPVHERIAEAAERLSKTLMA